MMDTLFELEALFVSEKCVQRQSPYQCWFAEMSMDGRQLAVRLILVVFLYSGNGF